MALAAGARLGPYEIVGLIGAGGMGEVYRARDPRIGRDVAVKVLPAAFSQDPDRVRRFEQEVRAAGALNHPNILTIYDVGTHEGCAYVVSELLEGETLRSRLSGSGMPQRKAIEYARGIAEGLAAAHEKGVVHRDLKPENLFLIEDGRVKILDFGLAKLTQAEPADANQTRTATVEGRTEPGVVIGTIGYMSPEQVRGQMADHRADIFSFGAILYEMLAGRRAFPGATAADSMTAILKEDPPALNEINPQLAPALDRIVRHCIEKAPAERFQSARDLAFDLAALSGTSPASGAAPAIRERPRLRRLALGLLGALVAAALVFQIGEKIGERAGHVSNPAFRQLTFRRGGILSARFAPDGQTIIYGAAWEGKPVELFTTRPESPESRSMGLPSADIFSISPSGEMAIALGRNFLEWWNAQGTLARVPLSGGAPREVVERVQEAQWLADGQRLAVVRNIGGRTRIEVPPGNVLHETASGISHFGLSPKGDLFAFIDHPFPPDDAGLVSVIDLAGKKRDLTPRYSSAQGLAWSPSGEEVWFTGAERGVNCALRAVPVSGGKVRTVLQVPGRLLLLDIAKDGRVLLLRETQRVGFAGVFPGDSVERDLSWLDLSFSTDLSADGKAVLISEQGEGAGSQYDVYLRKTDGSPAVKLGEGFGSALSPDGKWVLAALRTTPPQMVLLPTGAGEQRTLPRDPIESYEFNGAWLPNSKQVIFDARERGHGPRLYVQDVSGGKPRPISPEGVTLYGHAISPDGQRVAGVDSERRTLLCRIAGDGSDASARPAPGLEPGDTPIRWSDDGRWLYVFRTLELPIRIRRLEVETGRMELWKQIQPADPAGFLPFFFFQITPNGKYYSYTYGRFLDDLYLVRGLK